MTTPQCERTGCQNSANESGLCWACEEVDRQRAKLAAKREVPRAPLWTAVTAMTDDEWLDSSCDKIVNAQ